MCCLMSIASCQSKPKPTTVEVIATSKGCGSGFIEEHSRLFAENIRLKQELKVLQHKP